MLVLTRLLNEKILIGENVTVQVMDIRGDKVRLGIEAPKDVPIDREEVRQEKELEARREADRARTRQMKERGEL